jgi:predicted metal-binding membrane protein
MDLIQKIILISIISIAAISWILSKDQPDMMVAMMKYNPIAISLFTVSWTIGMAAMMFPAIAPMVLLYNRLTKRSNGSGNSGNTISNGSNSSQSRAFADHDDDDDKISETENMASTMKPASNFISSLNVSLFVGSYLLVWTITGIVLLLTWSLPANYFFMQFRTNQLEIVYGIVLIVAGVYQFSSLKTKCLGYCESPLGFFMRRWRSGTIGALKMGIYHGLYCLGCCWPYFLLMIALGWMNLLWMALFAAVIFGEKVWSKGIWIARGTGVGLAIVGIMAACGLIIIPTSMNNNGNDIHIDDIKMDMSKTTDAKRHAQLPATTTTIMPNMNGM